MGNPIKAGIAAICAGLCVFFTVAMLWAELGMASDMGSEKQPFPHTIKLLKAEGVFTSLNETMNGMFKEKSEKHLQESRADGPMGDYVYSAAIALAFLLGGFAIIAAGSDDEVEVTKVPVKK